MKVNFMQLLGSTFVLLSLLIGCISDDDKTVTPTETYTNLDEFYSKNAKASQSFEVDAALGGSIVGKEGTIITFPPKSILDASNNAVTGTVKITLQEFYSTKNMFFSNIHTQDAYGNVLVTGGSINLELSQAGNKLMLGKGVTAFFPDKTNANKFKNQMLTFTGNPSNNDAKKVIEWVQSNDLPITYDPNTQSPGYTLNSLQTGWTNCDALMKFYSGSQLQMSQFKVNIENGDLANTDIYLFVKGVASIIKIYTIDGTMKRTYNASIPIGMEGTLIAVQANGALKFGSKKITVAGDDVFNVSLSTGTTSGLTKLIDTLN